MEAGVLDLPGRSPDRPNSFDYNLGGEITSQSQPARKQSPPIGVIAPSVRIPVNPIAYRLPLKMIIPANSNHHAPRFAVPKKASTKSAIA